MLIVRYIEEYLQLNKFMYFEGWSGEVVAGRIPYFPCRQPHCSNSQIRIWIKQDKFDLE